MATKDYKVVGPFSQTLFLGCSISDINTTLAWASENSSCDVTLIRDYVSHETDPGYVPLHTAMSSLIDSKSATSKPDQRNSQFPGDAVSQTSLSSIAKFEKDKLDSHNSIDRGGSTNVVVRDSGKKLWNPYDAPNAPKHWRGPDPGFMGEIYSILGSPCQVRFQNMFFAGFITRWSYENAVYRVNLAAPGSLLRGTKLILGDYYGTISTRVQNFALPYVDSSNPAAMDSFESAIREGNIPNLINVFGALESSLPFGYGFGGSRTSDFGINARRVYDMIVFLLGNESREEASNPYSPYGGLVSRGPMSLNRGLLIPQSESISDSAGGSFNLSDFGLLKTVVGVDGLPRCIYRIDFSQVPIPADNIYLPASNIMSLDEFINFCCTGAGFDWNTSLEPDKSNEYTGIIKINTYSRKIQNPPTILKDYVRSFTAETNVVSYDIGEEYKDSNVRKVIMGGKQERLYQVMCRTLNRYQNAKIYNPIDNTWINTSLNMIATNLKNGHINNIVRIPLADSQRMEYNWKFQGAGFTAQADRNVNEPFVSTMGLKFIKGNYSVNLPVLTSINDPLGGALGGGFSGGAAYPLHLDLISPYFGRGFDGNVRKAFYDNKRRQILVNCPLGDLSKVFPVLSINPGYMTIYENEIRAALASFDSWLTYIFEPTKYGIWKPTARIIYETILAVCGPEIAAQLRFKGAGATKDQGKKQNPFGAYHTGNPISSSQAIIFSNTVMPILQGVYSYVSQELGQHYSKNYLVRVPSIQRYVGDDGVARYDWEITDSGWEEKENVLDDTMVIGDANASLLANENGKFGPILGWDNSQQKDYSWPPIGNLNVFARASRSNMRSILKGLASMSGKTDRTNLMYNPLNVDSDGINIRFNQSATDAFGGSVPHIDKFYQKASILDVAPENLINKKILYDGLADANYCVVAAPGAVTLHGRDFLVKTLYEDCAAEILEGTEEASYYSTINLQYMFQRFIAGATGAGQGSYLMMMVALLDGAFYSAPGSAATIGLNNESNMPIYARATVPCFAAIPMRYNRYVYGPWSTAPGLIEGVLFPGVANSSYWANNVVGGVDLDINPQYVPWEYEGMEKLDDAILTLLNDANEYQQIEEQGRITLAGVMLNDTNIGQRFQQTGPVCNGISVVFGPDGARTTYSFRTFSRKLGYFNKENAETIQKFGKQSLALRSQLVENINNLRQLSNQTGPTSGPSYSAPKSMSFSPVNILVGAAYPFIPKNSQVNNFKTQCKFDPKWPERPILPNSVNSNISAPKHISAVSLYDPAELDRALFQDEESYAQKSVMSLDGIFSPVSLYPTKYHSTFSLSKYRRSKCPMCEGAGTYTYVYTDENVWAGNGSPLLMRDAQESESIPCPYCVPDNEINTLKEKGADSRELTPPFLIASGTDRQIISDRMGGNGAFKSIAINNYSYSPIVLAATGVEFSCHDAKQDNDVCGYSIDAVAFGNVVPKPSDSLRAALSDSPSKNYAYFDTNAENPNFAQNYRFFGLRGPIILHSWGYDLEGYPVPNASGEYKLNGSTPVLDNDGNPVGKNQVPDGQGEWSEPYKESTFMKGWAQQPATWPVGPIDFRWDSNGRVWTIGSNYKPVWVVIEHDLVDENPVRGIILESSYSNNPLPSGLRKLVFVKDTANMFSAPRGAALYCRYDSANGFYEPIYNRSLVTSGIIQGARAAKIYTAYTPSSVSEDIVSEYVTVFDNPLQLTANTSSVGLFVFLNGKWILQASKD